MILNNKNRGPCKVFSRCLYKNKTELPSVEKSFSCAWLLVCTSVFHSLFCSIDFANTQSVERGLGLTASLHYITQ